MSGVRRKDKRERGNTPKHTKKRRENAPKRSKGPHAVHGQKTDTITLRGRGNSKTSKEETQKRPKEGNPKTRDNP